MTSLFYQDDKVSLYQADVLEWAIEYKKKIDAGEALPFHATISDPPYGLGAPPPIEELLRHWLDDKDYNTGVGFMSARWDCIVHPKYWRALLDICYPGAYLFVFSGTRTADLLGISCRLGGWEPFDRISNFLWTYGSGFPKSHSISKSLDATEIVHCPDCPGGYILSFSDEIAQEWAMERETTVAEAVLELSGGCETCGGAGQVVGAEREVVGKYQRPDGSGKRTDIPSGTSIFGVGGDQFVTAPATPLAQAFDGYGSALKPAGEPILLFRKPRAGRTFAECAREFGSGALNIDQCRMGTNEPIQKSASQGDPFGCNYKKGTGRQMHSGKRWPPNTHFTHVPHHSPCPTCEGARFVESPPFTESFKSWYAKTKNHGGTREEWQRLREPGGTIICQECHGEGAVGGCRRIGHKKVKGIKGGGFAKRDSTKDWRFDNHERQGYADSDGKEQVADFICVEGCAVRALDEMAGERKSGAIKPHHNLSEHKSNVVYGQRKRQPENTESSTGSASRFYPNHDWSYEIVERLAGETPFRYCAKASRGERDAGLTNPNMLDTMKPKSEDLSWESRDQNQSIQADEAGLTKKDTTALCSGIQKQSQAEIFSLMSGSGSKSMDPSRQDTISTTEMETSKTTELRTSNSLTFSPTSDCIADANSEVESGINPADFVRHTSPLIKSIGTLTNEDMSDTEGVKSAISSKPSRTNESDERDEGLKKENDGVRTRNPHPT